MRRCHLTKLYESPRKINLSKTQGFDVLRGGANLVVPPRPVAQNPSGVPMSRACWRRRSSPHLSRTPHLEAVGSVGIRRTSWSTRGGPGRCPATYQPASPALTARPRPRSCLWVAFTSMPTPIDEAQQLRQAAGRAGGAQADAEAELRALGAIAAPSAI